MNPTDDSFAQAAQALEAGRLADAELLLQKYILNHPTHAGAFQLLGLTMARGGRYFEARSALSRAIALRPEFADAHYSLGYCLGELGEWELAADAYQRAARLQPGTSRFFNNLGNALFHVGRLNEAIAAYERAVELQPDSAAALNNLGNALDQSGQLDRGIDCYRRAIELDHTQAAIWNNLGKTLLGAGRIKDSLEAYDNAIRISPSVSAFLSGKLFATQFDPDVTVEDSRRQHRVFGEWFEIYAARKAHENDRSPDRTLRIGYVSPDFRNHVIGRCLLPIFEHHNREMHEIYCYSGVTAPDEITGRFHSLASEWRSISPLSDELVDTMVRDDRIDILIDLSGHSAGNRLMVFAAKPAPVQITFLGYPQFTGLTSIDYHIGAPSLSENQIDPEMALNLPDWYWCYQPRGSAPEVAPLPADKNDFVTFSCLNEFAKMSIPAQKLWSQILARLPNSRLILSASPGHHVDELHHRFADWGIPDWRIQFVDHRPENDYTKTYSEIDIALDPFPCGGGVSSCDALWMGVPLITLPGEAAASRTGKSILHAVKLDELITKNSEEYVALAVQLAEDRAKLRAWRTGLRERMLASPLMNAVAFTANLESLFRNAWRIWCAGK